MSGPGRGGTGGGRGRRTARRRGSDPHWRTAGRGSDPPSSAKEQSYLNLSGKMYNAYWTRNRTLGVRNVLIVNFSCVLLQIKIATKSLLTNVTSVRLVIVVSVHVESKIVDLQCINCRVFSI